MKLEIALLQSHSSAPEIEQAEAGSLAGKIELTHPVTTHSPLR